MRKPKLGIVLILLQTQVLANVALLALAFFGGAYLIGFSQLPGGLWDVAASTDVETHLRATTLHLLLVAASITHLWWLRRVDPRSRIAAVVHSVTAVLTLPFALFLALFAGWHRDADWAEARHYASAVAGRSRLRIMGAWLLTVAFSSALAFGASIAILSGSAWAGLLLLAIAPAVQVAAYWLITRYEPKTKLRTYASPLPGLPGPLRR